MTDSWLAVDDTTYDRPVGTYRSIDARVRVHLARGWVTVAAMRDTEDDYSAAFMTMHGPRGGYHASTSWKWPEVPGAIAFLFNGGVAILNGAQRGDWHVSGQWGDRLGLEVNERPLEPAHRLAMFGPKSMRAHAYLAGEDLIRLGCALRICVDEVNVRMDGKP